MALDKNALREAVIDLIDEQDWRSGDEIGDYGYGGEVSYVYPALHRESIGPVVDKILLLVGSNYISIVKSVLEGENDA